MKKALGITSYLKRHKKWFLIGGAVLLVGIMASYVIWSMNTWSGYEARYQSWHNDIKKTTDSALSMSMKTDQEKTSKVAALSSIAARITNEKDTVCKVNGLLEWQNFIGTYKTRQDNCKTLITRLSVFSQKIQDVVTYFKDEKALTALIASQVNANEELTEAVWGAKLTSWQTARDSVVKTNPSEAFKPVKTIALEKVSAIVSVWQELISAHTAKSKPKFTEAQTKLNDSYGALSSIATTSASQFKIASESLQTAYTAAFK
jgi:hypothetical protein